MDAYVVECIRTLSHGEIRSVRQMRKIRRIRNQRMMRLDMIQSETEQRKVLRDQARKGKLKAWITFCMGNYLDDVVWIMDTL